MSAQAESSVALELDHAAMMFAGPDELLRRVVPIVAAAAAEGQVIIEAGPGVAATIADQLSGSAVRTGLLQDLRRHPHQLMWGLRQLLDEDLRSSRQVLVVSQLDLDTSRPLQAEWGRVEALFNHVLRDCRLTLLCLYDTRSLDSDVLARARATHPTLLPSGTPDDNPRYEEPRDYLRRRDADWAVDALEASPSDVRVDLLGMSDLARVRTELDDLLAQTNLRSDRCEDFTTAVFEIGSNAMLHGGPNPRIDLWRSGNRVHCRVRDEGPGPADPLAGYEPPGTTRSTDGFGMWSARQLADLMTTTREPPGFTVRLSVDY